VSSLWGRKSEKVFFTRQTPDKHPTKIRLIIQTFGIKGALLKPSGNRRFA